MHREYQPEDVHHLRAHAFDGDSAPARADDHRPLYLFTTFLGLLIGGDVVVAAYELDLGVSLAWVAAVLGGARIVYGALEALAQGRLGADFALAQACVAALVLGEPFVAAEVVFIAMVGEVLEAITAQRAYRAIHRLFDQTPRTARVRRDGVESTVPVGEVVAGDIVVVGPGERVPVDGPVLSGRSSVDQSALTGESAPVDKGARDPVFSGTVNQFGRLEVRAEKVGHDTTLGQVLRLVADAQHRKAPIQRAADRYARLFLPVVEGVAVATVVAGYLLGWPDVWQRAVAVLVVACPCALVLATPAAVLASMAWLARHGVVIKGGAALERLAACDTFAFDKTGTLTLGRPDLASVIPFETWSEPDLLRLAASAEPSHRHPLAEALHRVVAARGLATAAARDVTALPGVGVEARCLWEGVERSVLVGNRRLMHERGVGLDDRAEAVLRDLDARGETPLIVAVDGRAAGVIGVRDAVRPEAHDIIHDLKHLHITEIAILTGDRPEAAAVVAKRTHVKTVQAGLLPADKADWVRDRQAAGRRVAMVGDGINDAPALAQADVGIALGRVGSDLAAEAGDVIVLGEPLRVLPDLVGLSRATVAVIRQNILGFAFGLNALAMGAAALGLLGPVAAAILHQAGSLLVLLNAMRLLAHGDWRRSAPWIALRRGQHWLDHRLDPARLLGMWAERGKRLLAAGALVLVVLYATRGVTAIGPDEVGLLRRQGGFVRTLGPGLHVRWPPPWERVSRVEPDRMRGVDVGFRGEDDGPLRWESDHDRGSADESLVLTGDGQLVELAATVQYRLDPRPGALRRFAFGAAEPEHALRPLAEAVIRAEVGRRRLDDLLTTGRREAESAALLALRQRVDAYGLGMVVTEVVFRDVHPPLVVVDAFRDVSRAESERLRRGNEADTYRAERLTRAQGLAAATTARAEADRDGRAIRAGGEAESFRLRQEARSSAPDLTDQRLYHEELTAVLSGKSKLVLDPGTTTRRRHLVLPESPVAAPAVKGAIVDQGEGPR